MGKFSSPEIFDEESERPVDDKANTRKFGRPPDSSTQQGDSTDQESQIGNMNDSANRRDSYDSDKDSILSYGSYRSRATSLSSFSSLSSYLSKDEVKGVEILLAEPFVVDTALFPIYVAAVEILGPERFIKNLTRLLVHYSVDLRREADGWLQTNTARVMHSRATAVAVVVKESASSLTMSHQEKRNAELKARVEQKLQNNTDIDDAGEEVDEPGDENEEFTTRLDEAKAFMVTSKAFARFRENLRLFVFPNARQYIRAILQSAKVSETECSEISCEASWEIFQYCKSELSDISDGVDLGPVLTVTGSPENAEAMSCEDYILETWSSHGRGLLDAVNKWLTTDEASKYPETPTEKFKQFSMHIDRPAFSPGSPESANISLQGSFDELLVALEQLAWLAASFRIPIGGGLTLSNFWFESVSPPGSKVHHIQRPVFKLSLLLPRHINLVKASTRDTNSNQMCWIPLLSEGTLARGFPLPKRPPNSRGLKLPFSLMRILASLDGPIEYDDGIVLVGDSSLVFPSARHLDGSLQWHFVKVKDPYEVVDILENREWLRESCLEKLINSPAFLGYCRHAQVLVATQELVDSNSIERSSFPLSKERPEFAREVTTTTGFSVKSIWNISASSKIVLPRRIQVAADSGDFRTRLKRAASRSTLLYDSDTQCAWLVSELSVVLHITHLFVKKPWQKPLVDSTRNLPYATISSDGGDAAFKAITENSQQDLWVREEDGPGGKPIRFMNVVEDFMRLFHTIRKAMAIRKEKAGRLIRPAPLQGWEFLDLLDQDYFSDRELPKGQDRLLKSCWWKIPEYCDVLTVFGGKFGQLIRPDPIDEAVCKSWMTIPSGKGLLTASMPCLLELAKDCQTAGQPFRSLTRELEWGTPKGAVLFECQEHHRYGGHKCSCIPVQKIRKPLTTAKDFFYKEDLQFFDINAPDGALIFGDFKHFKLQKRRNENAIATCLLQNGTQVKQQSVSQGGAQEGQRPIENGLHVESPTTTPGEVPQIQGNRQSLWEASNLCPWSLKQLLSKTYYKAYHKSYHKKCQKICQRQSSGRNYPLLLPC
jgi:hypothetical protein